MPLTIQHQADSAGDKAVSLITNNGGTNVAAAFKGANLATQNGDSVADMVVSLDGEIISAKIDQTTPGTTNLVRAGSGATDDAAAAGEMYPLAGIYQSTVDEVDAGDVGRLRMTERRALITVSEQLTTVLYNSGGSGGASNGDLRSTSAVNFVLDNNHKINFARRRSLFVRNALDQAVTLKLWSQINGGYATVMETAIAAGARAVITPEAVNGGASASVVQASCMQAIWSTLGYFEVVAAVSPTSGAFFMQMNYQL